LRRYRLVFASKLSDVPNWGKKAVEINGRPILLINIKGQVYACENECPHQGVALTAGIVKEGHISCPRHGYRFDLKTGACLDSPEHALKVYSVQVQGDDILVEL